MRFLIIAYLFLSNIVFAESAYYGIAAEGYTSTQLGGAAILSGRMFTAPMGETLCRDANPLMSLTSSSEEIRIQVGALFSLKSLHIDAVDRYGRLLARVPVSIGVPAVDKRQVDYKHHDLTIRAKEETSVTIEVMSYCVPSIRHYMTLTFFQGKAHSNAE